MIGTRLVLLHPEIVNRSCGECQKYLHDDRPTRMGLPVIRAGVKIERIKGQRPRCEWCPKVQKGDPPVPDSAQDLSPRNRKVLVHYLECRAVGQFPADPWVRRHAMMIRQIEDEATAERSRLAQMESLGMMLSARSGGP